MLEDSSDSASTAKRSRLSHSSVLENEIASLKAELEHEQSLRELDNKRSQQLKARLERQIDFATEETEEAKQMLEELRQSSQNHIRQLRGARSDALEELRNMQEQISDLTANQENQSDPDIAESRSVLLESQLQARDEEIEALRAELSKVADVRNTPMKSPAPTKTEDNFERHLSPAPKAVMKELNKVRIELAESERKFRQLKRKSEDWNKKAQQYVHQKEAAYAAKSRAQKLETELKSTQKELEVRRASNERWEEFAKELGLVLKLKTAIGGPPEVATVTRHLQAEMRHTKGVEAERDALSKEIEDAQAKLSSFEKQARDAKTELKRAIRDQKAIEEKMEEANQIVRALQAQEAIWKRETESLRSLVKTFDDILPETKGVAVSKAFEVEISSLKEEIAVLQKERERLVGKNEEATLAHETLQKEHDRVLDKFTKIRDALMVERAKADKAEERAIAAEAQSGKGAFNPNLTRALHLEKNPLTDAIRERYQSEINSLKRRLEETTGEKPADNTGKTQPEVDPEKLHKRLKGQFKEQIHYFREGVYLITGFKIDMGFDKGGTPFFKVRSLYAEREDDILIFQWPKGQKQPKGLDLSDTKFAKLCAMTDAYQYLTKYHSMPAFMAGNLLAQFEKCTFVVDG